MSGDLELEQKRYLEGFMTGLQIAKSARAANGLAGAASSPQGGRAGEPVGPDTAALRAQERVL